MNVIIIIMMMIVMMMIIIIMMMMMMIDDCGHYHYDDDSDACDEGRPLCQRRLRRLLLPQQVQESERFERNHNHLLIKTSKLALWSWLQKGGFHIGYGYDTYMVEN